LGTSNAFGQVQRRKKCITNVTYLYAFNKTVGYQLAYIPNKYTISMFMVKQMTLFYPAYKERDP
jgi:hypothetical protein